MKTITLIALVVALGLAWSGVALPADDAKEKATDAKDEVRGAAETTKDTLKSAGEKVKAKTERAWDKTKAAVKGGRVRSAQEALRDKGFDPGPIDGVMGPRTRAAVRDFQQKEGIAATGELDLTTSSRLGMTAPSERSDASGTSPAAASPATSPAADPQKEKPVQKP